MKEEKNIILNYKATISYHFFDKSHILSNSILKYWSEEKKNVDDWWCWYDTKFLDKFRIFLSEALQHMFAVTGYNYFIAEITYSIEEWFFL